MSEVRPQLILHFPKQSLYSHSLKGSGEAAKGVKNPLDPPPTRAVARAITRVITRVVRVSTGVLTGSYGGGKGITTGVTGNIMTVIAVVTATYDTRQPYSMMIL